MVVVGTDVHKRTHTFVAVDKVGRKLGEKVVPATTAGHFKAVTWARVEFGEDIVWGIEDCRNLSARLGQRYYRKRLAEGDSTREALRCLKRRLSRVVYQRLHTDHQPDQLAAA